MEEESKAKPVSKGFKSEVNQYEALRLSEIQNSYLMELQAKVIGILKSFKDDLVSEDNQEQNIFTVLTDKQQEVESLIQNMQNKIALQNDRILKRVEEKHQELMEELAEQRNDLRALTRSQSKMQDLLSEY